MSVAIPEKVLELAMDAEVEIRNETDHPTDIIARVIMRAAEDERDRLYEEFTSAFTEEVYQIRGAAMWAGEVLRRKGAMLPANRARARQGGNNG